MKYYIASSFGNRKQVQDVRDHLNAKGWEMTYDWTEREKSTDVEVMKEVGKLEKDGVMNADVVIIMLPGGRGSHIEFGIAIGNEKDVYLYAEDSVHFEAGVVSAFYYLEQVKRIVGDTDTLVHEVIRSEGK